MKVQYSILAIVLVLASITGCKKNENPGDSSVDIPASTNGVYVLNEGNFGKSNSTLTFYRLDSNKVYQDVFGTVNGRSLGDTGNDIVIYGSKGFIVVNQSDKIEIFSTENNTSLGTVRLPNKSPRYIAVASETKAYVTNWGDNSVSIINPSTYTVIKDSIAVGSAPEGIAVADGKVYVCNSGWGSDSTVSVIDIATDTVIKQIIVGRGPETLGTDKDGNLFVECSGYADWSNSANDLPGSIFVIDLKTDSVISSIPLPLDTYGHPGEIAVSKNGYAVVRVKNGIARIDTKTKSLDPNVFIATTSAYSVAVDDATDYVFVADAKSYAEDGEAKIFDKSGNEIGKFSTGIIPGDIAFKQ